MFVMFFPMFTGHGVFSGDVKRDAYIDYLIQIKLKFTVGEEYSINRANSV